METTTTAGSLALLAWRLLEFYGKDPEPCFAASGLDREQLEDCKTRMSYQTYDDIWFCTEREINHPCAGLQAAQYWHPATFGVMGFAMLSSNTLRTSLERLVRYQQIVAEESGITLTETDKGLLVQQTNFRHQSGDFPFIVDVALSVWLHICRFSYGDVLDPVEVNLMRAEPDCAGRYYAFYRSPVNFSADSNNIILPLEAMDKRLPSANRQLVHMHDQVLQKYLAQRQRSDLIKLVREVIISHLPSGEVNKTEIAESMYMSNRTLQRKLQEEGANFSDLLNETRQELAIDYIQDDSLPLIEISYLLGFSDASSFSRAFKRWTGKTPAEARDSH